MQIGVRTETILLLASQILTLDNLHLFHYVGEDSLHLSHWYEEYRGKSSIFTYHHSRYR